jgi:hypothetical protein
MPLPPRYPVAWWPRESAPCCSCRARTSELQDVEGYPPCLLSPVVSGGGEEKNNKINKDKLKIRLERRPQK